MMVTHKTVDNHSKEISERTYTRAVTVIAISDPSIIGIDGSELLYTMQ